VQLGQVLDVVEAVFRVSQHPDIAEIERYGRDAAPGGGSPAGIKVRYGTGSSGLLFGDDKRDAVRIEVPAEMPHFKLRAPYTAVLAVRLLDAARPEPFTSWHLIALKSIGHTTDHVSGLRIECGDGSSHQLRATGMGSQTPEPDEDPALGYQIPAGVADWQSAPAGG
jgi:hypothetical protein